MVTLKINFASCMLLFIPCATLAQRKIRKTNPPILFPINAENRINEAYKTINGFTISEQERKLIEDEGGNPTYGEITFDGFATLLKDLKLTGHDVFYDLGSGVGKVCVQVALTTPAHAIGIELSSSRASKAEKVRQELLIAGDLKKKNKLKFIECNITDASLKNATVIFLCSTCFSKELMQKITEKIAKLKKGVRVLTLKELAPHDSLVLIHTYFVPMTWSDSSPVYLYELRK